MSPPRAPQWVRSFGREADNFEPLAQWLRGAGADLDAAGLRIAVTAGPGPARGVVAGREVPPGGRVAYLPASLVLSAGSVQQAEPFASELRAAEARCLARPQPVLRFWLYLIHARHRADSPHHAYVRHCPRWLETPLLWPDEDLRMLEGSSAGAAAHHMRREAWLDFQSHVRPLVQADPEHFPADVFTLHALLWARSTCAARAFPAWVVDGSPEHAGASCVLCPLLDLFNHRRGADLQWRRAETGPRGLEFRLHPEASALKEGEEIWNDYGPKSNEDLLLSYGFCTPGNRDDVVHLLLRARGDLGRLRACAERLRPRHRGVALVAAGGGRLFALTVGPFRLRHGRGPPPDLVEATAELFGDGSAESCVAAARAVLLRRLRELLARLPKAPRPWRQRGGDPRTPGRAAACRDYLQGQRVLLEAAATALEEGGEAGALEAELDIDLLYPEEEEEEQQQRDLEDEDGSSSDSAA